MDMNINDPRFARAMAEGLLAMNLQNAAHQRPVPAQSAPGV